MGYKNDTEQIIQIDNQQLQEDITSNSNKIGNLSATGYTDLSSGIIDHTSQLADIAINVESYPIIIPEVDDTARIKRAVSATDGKQAKLLFKSFKDYVVSDFIDLPNNIEIVGNQANVKNTVAGLSFLFKAEGKTNVKVRSLNFITDAVNKANCGLRVIGCTNVIIKYVQANEFQLSGVIVTTTTGLEIKKSIANNNVTSRGFDIQASEVVLSNLTANGNGKEGIYVWANKSFQSLNVTVKECTAKNNKMFGFNTFGELDTVAGTSLGKIWGPVNLKIEHCIFTSNGNNGSYSGLQFVGVAIGWILDCVAETNNEHGIVLMDSRYIEVTENKANNNNMSGIRLQGDYSMKASYDGSWRGVWYSRIHDNTCEGNGSNPFAISNPFIDGIAIDYNCQYNVIESNTLKDNHGYGINLKHTSGYADCINNDIRKNKYINNTSGEYFVDSFNVKYNEINEKRKQISASVDTGGVLTLGTGDFFVVNSTTVITSINSYDTYVGRVIWLRFANTETVTRGNNILISSDFNATTNDVLQLISDGVSWYEVSRSAN